MDGFKLVLRPQIFCPMAGRYLRAVLNLVFTPLSPPEDLIPNDYQVDD